MADQDRAITLEEARDALLRSGYLLERRVESVLDQHGYFVEANPVYPDPYTGKNREYDLHALRFLGAGDHKFDGIWPVLLVECVNSPQPIVFFTRESNLKWLCEAKLSGVPVKITTDGGDSWDSLADALRMEEFHHYCGELIASQYCSFQRKKKQQSRDDPEWMAFHDERHFDAVKKLCDVVDYHQNKHFDNWAMPSERHEEYVNIQAYYPTIVVQGSVYEAHLGPNGLALREVSHILYCQNAIRGNEETPYLIDVITEPHLPDFLNIIDNEAKRLRYRAKRNKHKINASIDLILVEAKELQDGGQSPRQALEL